MAIKCADISNPCRTWQISRIWSLKACQEFFRQGDYERELELPVTPICDRLNISVAKVQDGFYRFVAEPLFKEWHRYLTSPLSKLMLENLRSNHRYWNRTAHEDSSASDSEPGSTSSCDSQPAPSSRRHSLPLAHHKLFAALSTNETGDRTDLLYRQLSLSERRRSSILRDSNSRYGRHTRRRQVKSHAENGEQVVTFRLPLQSRENVQDGSGEDAEGASKQERLLDQGSADKADSGKENMKWGNEEALTRRRGSAPSSLVVGGLLQHHQTRRGSLPLDLLVDSTCKGRIRLHSHKHSTKRRGLVRRKTIGPEQLGWGLSQDRRHHLRAGIGWPH